MLRSIVDDLLPIIHSVARISARDFPGRGDVASMLEMEGDILLNALKLLMEVALSFGRISDLI